jgi:hypothetical protein
MGAGQRVDDLEISIVDAQNRERLAHRSPGEIDDAGGLRGETVVRFIPVTIARQYRVAT